MLGITSIEKISTDVDVISELANTPDLSPVALKNKFDESAKALKEDINKLITEINSKLEIINNLLSAEEVKQAIEERIIEVGSGDMTKAVYDTDGDGIVDNAAKWGGAKYQYGTELPETGEEGDIFFLITSTD